MTLPDKYYGEQNLRLARTLLDKQGEINQLKADIKKAEDTIAGMPALIMKLAHLAIADHSLCVDEDTPAERIIAPSLIWFVEDYLPAQLAALAEPAQQGDQP